MKKSFLLLISFFLFSACDSAEEEKTSLRNVTGSVIESGKNQVNEIKTQTKETTDSIKEGVANVKNAAKEIQEAEEAVGKLLGGGEQDSKSKIQDSGNTNQE